MNILEQALTVPSSRFEIQPDIQQMRDFLALTAPHLPLHGDLNQSPPIVPLTPAKRIKKSKDEELEIKTTLL